MELELYTQEVLPGTASLKRENRIKKRINLG
jgi:hypothetical protein